MKRLQIQSVSDIITNSSNEVFIVEKDLMLDVVKEFDDKFNTCFEIKKITLNSLYLSSWQTASNIYSDLKFEEKCIYDLMIFEIIKILGISCKQAKKEGAPIVYNQEYNDYYFDYNVENTGNKRKDRALNKKKEIEICQKYLDFCKKHLDEIKEKVVGTYWMNVEDHFYRYADFREYMMKNISRTVYYESRH